MDAIDASCDVVGFSMPHRSHMAKAIARGLLKKIRMDRTKSIAIAFALCEHNGRHAERELQMTYDDLIGSLSRLSAIETRKPKPATKTYHNWYDKYADARLDALEAVASVLGLSDELEDAIFCAREEAGWMMDDCGEWHEPGSDGHNELMREQAAYDRADYEYERLAEARAFPED